MTNDEWIAFKDKLTADQREAVDNAVAHFGVVYEGTLAALIGMLKQTEEHQEGVRGQLARFIGNQDLVLQHLERQDTKLEAVKEGQSLLADTFSTLAESVDGLTVIVSEHATAIARHEAIIQDFARSRDESIQQRNALQTGQDELRANQETMAATLARIEAMLLTTEERKALRQLLEDRGR